MSVLRGEGRWKEHLVCYTDADLDDLDIEKRAEASQLIEESDWPGFEELKVVCVDEKDDSVVAVTGASGSELLFVTHEDAKGHGIATMMVSALLSEVADATLEDVLSGDWTPPYEATAGSQEGASFLHGLPSKLGWRAMALIEWSGWHEEKEGWKAELERQQAREEFPEGEGEDTSDGPDLVALGPVPPESARAESLIVAPPLDFILCFSWPNGWRAMRPKSHAVATREFKSFGSGDDVLVAKTVGLFPPGDGAIGGARAALHFYRISGPAGYWLMQVKTPEYMNQDRELFSMVHGVYVLLRRAGALATITPYRMGLDLFLDWKKRESSKKRRLRMGQLTEAECEEIFRRSALMPTPTPEVSVQLMLGEMPMELGGSFEDLSEF